MCFFLQICNQKKQTNKHRQPHLPHNNIYKSVCEVSVYDATVSLLMFAYRVIIIQDNNCWIECFYSF